MASHRFTHSPGRRSILIKASLQILGIAAIGYVISGMIDLGIRGITNASGAFEPGHFSDHETMYRTYVANAGLVVACLLLITLIIRRTQRQLKDEHRRDSGSQAAHTGADPRV